MSDQLPAPPDQPAGAPGALRMLALGAVCAGFAALAGAAFVLSYQGIHSVALQAGVSARLARGYPLMIDLLLVIVLAAALSLRGAGWPSKLLAWITLLALLAAAAGADALHAAGRRLPARPASVTAAILPWVLVLIAFALLLAMLRHLRLRRAADRGAAYGTARIPRQPEVPSPLSTQPLVPGFAAGPAVPGPDDTLGLTVPRQITADSAADIVADLSRPALEPSAPADPPEGEPATDAGLAPDDASSEETAPDDASSEETAPDDASSEETAPEDPSSEETAPDPADGALPYPAESLSGEPLAAPDDDDSEAEVGALSPPPAAAGAAADPEMPVFHRMWSTPVPPESADE